MLYLILSCVLLVNNNPYQQSVYLTSANAVCAKVYEGMSSITDYFHLKGINNDLQERNALLEMELVDLRAQINDLKMQLPDTAKIQPVLQHFDFVVAHVISNSIAQPNNYITINRGHMDGIRPEMGVIDQNGVVGIVNVVGPHASRVISLLNPHIRLSCKLRNSNFYGSLVWDGKSPQYAVLEELPKHVKYKTGDTIVTSGYSAVFPPGIIVGTVQGATRGTTDSFVSLRIKLTTNFSQLSSVRVITNSMQEQIDALRRAEQGIDTAANIETRPEIKPEIVDVVPEQDKSRKPSSMPEQPGQQVQVPQPVQAVEPDNNPGGEEQP